MQEIRVRSMDGKDPLEKETATYPSIPAWEIPGTEEPTVLRSLMATVHEVTKRLT